MGSAPDPLALDWPEICRRAAMAAQAAVDGLTTTAARSRGLGRGQGGDTTLAIDRAAEDAVIAELEATGAPLTLVTEERGELELNGGGRVLVVLDPIDGSLNAKRSLAPYAVSIAVADGETMGDVFYSHVRDLARGEEFTATRGEGALLDGGRLAQPAQDARLEILGVESAHPHLVEAAAHALADTRAGRLRMPGSIALSLCYVAAGRFDAMLSLTPGRSVDVAAGQLIAREAGAFVALPDAARNPVTAGLDLATRSRCYAGATPALLEQAVAAGSKVGYG
jgi:myo-inositol-1(or 4)-monophosphatase